MNIEDVREHIEGIIGEYCDGTWNGLEDAHFIEWFANYNHGPQECADRIVEFVSNLIEI